MPSPASQAPSSFRARENRALRWSFAASGLLLGITAVWFTAAFGASEPVGLLWLPSPLGAVILTVVFAQVARARRLPVVTRQFFGTLCAATALVGAATVVQAVDALTRPEVPGPHVTPAMLSIDAVAIALIMVALYRIPLGRRDGAERLRVGLDAGTVMLATAVFIWHFQTRHALNADDGSTLIASALLIVLAQLAVFAVVKVVLSGRAFIDKGALRLLALAMLIGSLSSPLATPVERHTSLFVNQLALPAVFFVAACGAYRQMNALTRVETAVPSRRRPFSVLPYAAVAAVDGLLMVIVWTGDDARVVAGTAVLLTALVVLRQITAFQDNQRLLDRLDHNATHDPLTGLPNRSLFNERLRRAVTDLQDPVAVVLADLDDFKTVNDTLGHAAGDTLLVTVAQRLRDAVPAHGTVARLGGDEFSLLLPGHDAAATDRVIRSIIDALYQPVEVEGRTLRVRASFGVAGAAPGDDAAELLRRADVAMYEAKARGEGSWQHHTPGMQARGAALEQASSALRQALHDDQLRLHYQPIVRLDDDHLAGVEALLRWQHPERGLIGAPEIIPIIEASGLIIDIGRWVLRAACRQMAAWHDAYPASAPPTISINVSAQQLREPSFAAEVAAALTDHHLPAQRLIIEITESTAIGGGATADTLAALRALGIRVALDDFGTGQSTLSLLAACPIDQIKLDRSFLPDEHSSVIAAAVLQLARGFGLDTVAEGVETPAQVERLRTLGYQQAQGYHFARPMPADALEALLVTEDQNRIRQGV